MSEDFITAENVDNAILDAIKRYSEIGMILDALFWNRCLGLLQKKYNFHLKRSK